MWRDFSDKDKRSKLNKRGTSENQDFPSTPLQRTDQHKLNQYNFIIKL